MFDPPKLPKIKGTMHPRFDEILTPEALAFIAKLDGAHSGRRAELLQARRERGKRISAGEPVDFLDSTTKIRSDPSWKVAPPAPGLEDRRCEITGPPTPKMTINALNSGAKVWMADFEDATAPSWSNIIGGQINLYDAIRGKLEFTSEDGKEYKVGAVTPTIVVRPRGWRLCEKHISVHGRPLPAALVDFGLFFFHNAQQLIDNGVGPYFYLPKLESHLEARLWNDVFVQAQALLGIPQGTIRATVLIETLPAAFEMEEILYELRDHSSGLNAGRWDYIFSYIKTFAHLGDEYVLPDRSQISMTTPFMRSYTELMVSTCHRRGAHAIGGMAAFVPNKADPKVTEQALAKVKADKEREAADGFDGSWVAHPGLVPTCVTAFTEVLGDRPNQLDKQRPDVQVTADDLIAAGRTPGTVTLAGLGTNIAVALQYLTAWVSEQGAVTIDNLMEDAATVEISRTQVWQWLHHKTKLAEGLVVTPELVHELVDHEVDRLLELATDDRGRRHVREAADVFVEAAMGDELPGFFTPYAYVRYLIDRPLQLHGPLKPEDLRMSEQVPRDKDSRQRV